MSTMHTPPTTGNRPDLRLEQIAECLAHLEAVFSEPGSLGDCSVVDAANSLASEFVGAFRDDEITSRLAKMIDAEIAGQPTLARRHLLYVRSAIARKWSAPRPSPGSGTLATES